MTESGRRLPPLAVRGKPGDVWPGSAGKRLTWKSPGPGGALRALVPVDLVTAEARRVVDGAPGSWIDIGATSAFAITEAEGVVLTFDLRLTFAARPSGEYVRVYGDLGVLDSRASGYGAG